ncbi:MAG: type II toxin -antitoxin system TacA 1-like antitoxin [Microbacteriaceae bacterium]
MKDPHSRRPVVYRDVSRFRGTLACMAETLTIRLDAADRAVLEAAARKQGKGLSAFVRETAEAQARQVRREMIRTDGQLVVAYLAEHPDAGRELDELGTPLSELP